MGRISDGVHEFEGCGKAGRPLGDDETDHLETDPSERCGQLGRPLRCAGEGGVGRWIMRQTSSRRAGRAVAKRRRVGVDNETDLLWGGGKSGGVFAAMIGQTSWGWTEKDWGVVWAGWVLGNRWADLLVGREGDEGGGGGESKQVDRPLGCGESKQVDRPLGCGRRRVGAWSGRGGFWGIGGQTSLGGRGGARGWRGGGVARVAGVCGNSANVMTPHFGFAVQGFDIYRNCRKPTF